jgi:glyoxylase-like metal-dependent hydrolase (beta-lactamase superfamily II)
MTDWVEHGDGVYSRMYASLSLNVGVVDCGDAVAVVDTRAHPGQAEELIADLRRLTALPVGLVINTHHHWDHTFGNSSFRPAPIWGHVRCAEILEAEGELMRDDVARSWPGPDGEQIGRVEIVPPDHTFTGSAAPGCEGRTIELRYLGRGHTDNDIVASVPDAGVVFAGDLIEEAAPPVYGDAYPLEWPATLRSLLGLEWKTAVPGHGTPVDRSFVTDQAAEITQVARLAAERYREGMSPAEAARAGGPFGSRTLQTAFGRAWEHLHRGEL